MIQTNKTTFLKSRHSVHRIQVNIANISSCSAHNTSGSHSSGGHHSGRSSPSLEDEEEEEEATTQLLRWRGAVARAASAAQLNLCLVQLHKCIAWEKSIMKVVSIYFDKEIEFCMQTGG